MISSPENKEVFLVGAGGHARAVYGLLNACGYSIKGFFDDHLILGEKIGDASPSGKLEDIKSQQNLVLSIGDNALREKYYERFGNSVLKSNVVHPSSIIFKEASMGESNLVFAKVVVNAFAQIGNDNIFNTGCIIEHEVKVGSHNHISLNAVLAGRVIIGNGCFIGAGAVIKDGVRLVDGCIIGAGAVVIDDLIESGTYVGVPAKKIK